MIAIQVYIEADYTKVLHCISIDPKALKNSPAMTIIILFSIYTHIVWI